MKHAKPRKAALIRKQLDDIKSTQKAWCRLSKCSLESETGAEDVRCKNYK